MLIKAAVTHSKGADFVIEDVELAEPKNNEVLVKITASGVCHTDAAMRDQLFPVPLPAVLGHEGAGVVVKVGSGVSSVKPGDHVVLSFSSCGHCDNCLSGKPYACSNFIALNMGGVNYDGTHRLKQGDQELSTFFGQSSFATYAVVHERNCVVVDKDVDLRFLGALGCGFQTGAGSVLNGLKPEFGSSIVVFGCGSVGFSALMAAKLAGCSTIIAVGGTAKKLELAIEIGATHTINTKEEKDVVGKIKSITNGGANYALDTTGVPEIINNALYSLRALGTLALVGATGEMTINIMYALTAEGKTMLGLTEGNSVPQVFIPKLVNFYKEGKFPIDKISTLYDFKDINKAFEDSHKGIVIKPVVVM